jgi:phage FluMu gp28-like protein
MAKRKASKSAITASPDVVGNPSVPATSVDAGPINDSAKPNKSRKKKKNEPFDWNGAIPVLPYQWRWIKDDSPLKVAVWSHQSGKSFAAALRAVIKCVEKHTQYIILSKGERQSRMFMEKVKDFCQIYKETKYLREYDLVQTEDKTMEVHFPHNGSRIIGLPANPDTARGYSGNIVLDEFAFHGDAHRIYAACFPIITRGYSIEVISTPNGTAGKFYEIAKAAGLVGAVEKVKEVEIVESGSSLTSSTLSTSSTPSTARWSGHRVDIYDAVREGLPAKIDLLRSGCDDEETWLQEYCCQFLSDAQNYIPIELISSCVHEEATTDGAGLGTRVSGLGESQNRDLYLGVDIGRKHDLTIAWLFEKVGGVLWSRLLKVMKGVSFDTQEKEICNLIEGGCLPSPGSRAPSPVPVRRCCVDQSGLGMMLAEHLVQKYGSIVEPVQFTASLKERLAPLVKQAFEERTVRIPDNREVRADINSVKRFITLAGNVRFDAEHTDRGHADRFWALAMVVNAATEPAAHFDEIAGLVGSPVLAGFANVVL